MSFHYRDLRKTHSHLLPFFQNACNFWAGIQDLNQKMLESIKKTTLSSEYLYIDIDFYFPLSRRRGEFHLFADILYHITRIDHRSGHVFLNYYKNTTHPVASVHKDIIFFTKNCPRYLKNIHKAFSFIFSFPHPGQQSFLFRQLGCIIGISPGVIPDFLSLYTQRLSAYPWPVFQKWLKRGIDLITSRRIEEGMEYLLIRSKESRWLLNLNHVTLSDLKNILKIYCSSLSGREMIIAGLDSSGFGLKSPYTDGRTIFLPAEIDYFNNPEQNERVFTAIAAQQAASVGMGTFELNTQILPFRTELRERYGTQLPQIIDNVRKQWQDRARRIHERPDGEIEVVFPGERSLTVLNSQHEKFFYSFPTPGFARELFILIENSRIEFKLSSVYPGLKEDFTFLNKYLWEKRPEIRPPKEDRQAQFFAVLEALIQHSLVKKWKGDTGSQKLKYQIYYVTHEYDAICNESNSVQDSARITFILYNYFFDNFPLVTIMNQETESQTIQMEDKPEILPEIVLDVAPELLKEETAHINPEELKEGDEEQAIDLSSLRQEKVFQELFNESVKNDDIRIFRYPEYNCYRGCFERNHCTLFERPLEPVESDYYERVKQQYKAEYKRIKNRFLYLKAEEMEISRRWFSGEDIHMMDSLDYTVSLKRSEVPDEKIYFRRIKNRRDIVTAVLIDASSSTDEAIHNTKKIEIEKAALTLLSSALSIIGDTFGLFSFFSMGRRRIFYNIIKDFDEPWERSAQNRIPQVKAYASNRDGCAIRHTTSKLLAQPNKIKLFILLSDGIPADVDYGSRSSSETSKYAIEDTRRAILESRQQGIIPYCITIDRFAREYIPHLYGDFQYAVLDDAARLPEKMSRLYLRLTR
jgi:nitric oxide reductase NorD protein